MAPVALDPRLSALTAWGELAGGARSRARGPEASRPDFPIQRVHAFPSCKFTLRKRVLLRGKGSAPPLTPCSAAAPRRLHRTLLAWSAQGLGGLFLVRAFWVHTVVVSDPLLVHSLLKRRSDAGKSEQTYSVVNPLFGGLPSLFSASTTSPYWRAVRKGIAPAFNMRSLRCAAAGDSGGGGSGSDGISVSEWRPASFCAEVCALLRRSLPGLKLPTPQPAAAAAPQERLPARAGGGGRAGGAAA